MDTIELRGESGGGEPDASSTAPAGAGAADGKGSANKAVTLTTRTSCYYLDVYFSQ